MQRRDDQLLFAASDLMSFSQCRHQTAIDRLHLDVPQTKTDADEHAQLIRKKGHEHEQAYLEELRAKGLSIIEIPETGDLREQVRLTQEALSSGPDIIYQAALLDEPWLGKADFLLKVDEPSDLGDFSYEVADTKLARNPKPYFLLQLCLYSEILAGSLGRQPKQAHVVLGNKQQVSFDLNKYIHYYRRLKSRFTAFVDGGAKGTVPDPCAGCDLCHWHQRCEDEWLAADHLSQVANITRLQRKRLVDGGIESMATLATAADGDKPHRISLELFEKLRGQAALQVKARETNKQTVKHLPLDPDGMRGFYRMPRPSPGDVFFDIEGYPLADGGLEYLLGIYFEDEDKPVYKAFWGHDRAGEGNAFRELVDFVSGRLCRYPDAHIYHYAHYEESALKKLMSLHGARETVIDDWLRKGKLIDLYKVVREAILVSQPSYSIKNLEIFYMEARTADVMSAGASVVEYDKWIETGEDEILQNIQDYNEDDCRSTLLLRNWLLEHRPDKIEWPGANDRDQDTSSDEVDEEEAARLAFREEILHCDAPEELRNLVAQLVDFHTREGKPAWWSRFQWQDALHIDLIDDTECLGDLRKRAAKEGGQANGVVAYSFPPQDSKLGAGDKVHLASDRSNAGTIVSLDLDEGSLTMRVNSRRIEALPDRISLTPGNPVPTKALKDAVHHYATALVEGKDDFKALTSLLLRTTPRIKNVSDGEAIVSDDTDIIGATSRAVLNMDETYLCIQGPPGAGKTHVGSRVIVDLIRSGKRVGVAANSHKAVNNLLGEVEAFALEEGVEFRGCKKVGTSQDSYLNGNVIRDVKNYPQISGADNLVGGTAWLFARGEFEQMFDYLFIDEAGQISLGNLVAMGLAAKNIVLLGDQMQLGQPTKAVHPEDSGRSALEFILGDLSTIRPNQGIFLPQTWRMHENVCQWVSENIYDGRLKPHPANANQCLILDENADPNLRPTGISFVEVEHHGCSQRSQEEAEAIGKIYANLIGQRYTDRVGIEGVIGSNDVLVVAPYNMQVNLLKRTLPGGTRVGTVDKFQGQQAEVVILSMTSSSGEDISRGIDFLLNRNRLNVAISRARSLAVVVASPRLLEAPCSTVDRMALVNLLCSLQDYAKIPLE